MKINLTNNIMSAVYSYCKAENIYDRCYWSSDEAWENEPVTIIDGATATKNAADLHLKICSTLQEGVGYIFRFTKNGKLYPYHVTMLPKTAANIEHGSRRYGSASIASEVR